ncbi:MAG: IclR family transcriptional regulator [Actinomycetes bacterium]
MLRPPAKPARAGGVQSLDRAFELLELMAAAGGEVALSQLAAPSGLPVPTIHRIVRTLVTSGYVLQLPSRRYALGPRLIGLGESASRTVEAWSSPHLLALAETSGETANLAMLDAGMVVYVAQAPSSRHTMRMFTEVGRRVYAHCTGVGKALLAQLPEDDVRGIVARAGMPARTEHTITDVHRLLAELGRVRTQGYAVDDGEQEPGVRCVAVAVPGSPSTALSVSGPAGRVTHEAVRSIVPVLLAAADGLAGRIDRGTRAARAERGVAPA